MNAEKITTEEMVGSLTGFDEIAIAKAFGAEVLDLMNSKPITGLRALVFVQERRDGKTDAEAKNAALSLTLDQVQDRFEDDEDEPMPEEPTTPAGEGDSLPE